MKAIIESLPIVVVDAIADGLTDVEETIMVESFPEVPRKQGDLEGSAFANDAVVTPEEQSVTMGYNIVYAVPQHENLEFYHPKKGKAKYLEDPANRVAPSIPDIMAKHVEPAIRSAGGGE
jgi:hypothetical protein